MERGYDHTQSGYPAFNLLLMLIAAASLVLAVFTPGIHGWGAILARAGGALVAAVALSFKRMRVRDAGDHLSVRLGPIPTFGLRIPYADIRSVELGESRLIDGWGIHGNPMDRSWICNVRRGDVVHIQLLDRLIRVGSDEAPALRNFLLARTGLPSK